MSEEIPDLDLGLELEPQVDLDDAELNAVLEALLLVVDTPVPVATLATVTQQTTDRVAATLQRMAGELEDRGSGIDLREAGGGWRMYTRARYAPYRREAAARRVAVEADARGAGDAGGGRVPPAGDPRAGERGARGER